MKNSSLSIYVLTGLKHSVLMEEKDKEFKIYRYKKSLQ
jgi:hypothetical protein